MALIQCSECGHMVSDKAEACPNCGCPVERPQVCEECGATIPAGAQFCKKCGCPVQHQQPYTAKYQEYNYKKAPKKSLLFGALMTLLVCALAGGGYYLLNHKKGASNNDQENVLLVENVLVDGLYSYLGQWNQSGSQSCKIEFEKKNGSLTNCSYTNLKYNVRIPLDGTIKGDSIHFMGKIDGKDLVIKLKPSPDGNALTGYGIDYAHGGEKIKLTFYVAKNEIDVMPVDEQETAVEEPEVVAKCMEDYTKDDLVMEGSGSHELTKRTSGTWAGASSVSALRQNLDGTSWYINDRGFNRKFVFSNGSVTYYTSLNGDFDGDGHYYGSYEVKSRGEYIVVFFGLDEEHMEYRDYQIGFAGNKAVLFQFGKPIGELTFMRR